MPLLSAVIQKGLLEAARHGDHDAFRRPVEPHRGELHAPCYRMVASVHDAEDALQESVLRAWRGLPRFEGRSSLRSWLYRIATSACLDRIAQRPKRALPVDIGPAADPTTAPANRSSSRREWTPIPTSGTTSRTATPVPRPGTNPARAWSWRSSWPC